MKKILSSALLALMFNSAGIAATPEFYDCTILGDVPGEYPLRSVLIANIETLGISADLRMGDYDDSASVDFKLMRKDAYTFESIVRPGRYSDEGNFSVEFQDSLAIVRMHPGQNFNAYVSARLPSTRGPWSGTILFNREPATCVYTPASK